MFNSVLCDGPVILLNWNDRASKLFSIVSSALFIAGLVLALLGVFPGITLKMATAFAGGFIAASMWGTLMSIWIWESGTGRKLYCDLEVLDIVKGGKHADG